MSQLTLSTGVALNVLLINAFHAYRDGLRRQPEPHRQVRHHDFDSLKFLGTLGWAPLGTRLQLRRLQRLCGRGLVASRNRELDLAFVYYRQAGEELDSLKDVRLAWLLGVSTYEAGVAYMDFRCGLEGQARERLDRAMDADLELENAGLPVMLMHRIQQGHNLARMDVRLGRRAAAVELTGMLLAYMERRLETLSFHHDWGFRTLQAIPRSLTRTMIHQIIAETAGFIVTGNAPAKEWYDLIEASRVCCGPESPISPQAQFALQAQYEWLVEQNPAGYLKNLERFFSIGIRGCHMLWYAMMLELVRFCREVDTRHSRQVKDVILRDSVKWQGLPDFLRDRLHLENPAAERTVA